MALIVINSNAYDSNGEQGIARVKLAKTAQTLSGVNLIRGDSRIQKIEMELSRYYGGVDLSALTFVVYAVNADGNSDVYTLFNPEITEYAITFTWVVYGVATAAVGSTRFEVEGVNQEDGGAVVWQSGIMAFPVVADLGNIPDSAQEQELTNLQKLILYVNEELPTVLAAREATIEATANAQEATTAADDAALAANEAAAAGNDAAASANAAAESANREATAANDATADAREATQAAITAKKNADKATASANIAAGNAQSIADEADEAEVKRKEAEALRVAAERQREIDFEGFTLGFSIIDGKLCVKIGQDDETAHEEGE